MKQIITQALGICNHKEVVALIDNLKDLGFRSATLSGLSVAVSDCIIIPQKEQLIKASNHKVAEIEKNFKMGLITAEEKKRLSNEVWMDTTEDIAQETWQAFVANNPVKIIIDSGGTRASKDQVKQLAAMRGLVVDPLGKIVELPTKSNFREGLSIFEYITSTRGSRKGLTDSALKTADAGYLTRRLVDVAHDVIVRSEDCHTEEGIEISAEGKRKDVFTKRIIGKVLAQNITSAKTKKILFKKNELIDEEKAQAIVLHKINKVLVRSPLTCQTKYGVCVQCYGWDLSTKKLVEIGTPVGVIAAQSIGEPGTQLTMRVKHAGGIVGLDVTQGLPRVEELFEARIPKFLAPLSEIAGRATVQETKQGILVTIKSLGIKPPEEKEYLIPIVNEPVIKTGDLISPGQQLSTGNLDLNEILKTRGLKTAQQYLIEEIQAVYESQGIPINDKHFEVIIRKMSDKVKIESPGDTPLLPGELVDKARFQEENSKIIAEGGEPATAQIVILGITRSSLYTESWLSASSFQNTINVLTEVAIQGKIDKLLGLKENVIIGRLIPTSAERALITTKEE
jgi:DNA-directed RNA polymerase subunit beta'